jgi:hypothetical protein
MIHLCLDIGGFSPGGKVASIARAQREERRVFPMKKKRWYWILWFSFLLLLDYTVPYTVLSGVNKVYGAFLFWNLFALTAIASIFVLLWKWRN